MKQLLLSSFLLFALAGFSQNYISTEITESFKEQKQDLDSIARSLNYKGGDQIRIITTFKVNEVGEVVDIKASSVHPAFEEEAIRILKNLPKMNPAQINGKFISQKFALPIVFKVGSEREKRRRLKKEKKKSLKS